MEEKLKGIRVIRKYNESIHQLARRFRKKYLKSGILIDIKENMYYRKPSDKKRRKDALARLRRLREERKSNLKSTKKRRSFNYDEIDYRNDGQDNSGSFTKETN